MNKEEDQNLKNIRKQLKQSKQEFAEGEGVSMKGNFLEKFLKRMKKNHLSA